MVYAVKQTTRSFLLTQCEHHTGKVPAVYEKLSKFGLNVCHQAVNRPQCPPCYLSALHYYLVYSEYVQYCEIAHRV